MGSVEAYRSLVQDCSIGECKLEALVQARSTGVSFQFGASLKLTALAAWSHKIELADDQKLPNEIYFHILATQ